jgi:hypothetical protein
MTSNGLRAQYLIPNLSLSAIAYPSIRPFRSGHVIMQSRKISANSLPAERKQIADRGLLCRIFLKKPSFFRTDFFTELDPQTRLLPVPNFGVNRLLVEFGASVSRIELYNSSRFVSLFMLFYVILLLLFTFVYYVFET